MNLDLAPVQRFLDGNKWNTIVHEACDLQTQEANDLLDLIHLSIDSLHFFMKRDITNRATQEYNNLINLISYIETTI